MCIHGIILNASPKFFKCLVGANYTAVHMESESEGKKQKQTNKNVSIVRCQLMMLYGMTYGKRIHSFDSRL